MGTTVPNSNDDTFNEEQVLGSLERRLAEANARTVQAKQITKELERELSKLHEQEDGDLLNNVRTQLKEK